MTTTRSLNRRGRFKIALLTILIVLVATVSFWSVTKPSRNTAMAMESPMALPVNVEIVTSEPMMSWRAFSGRMEAVNVAEIRPQVGGTIVEIHFEDGQHVDKDDVLYVIDPRPYVAAVQLAQAELSSAKNAHDLAKTVFERAQGLIESASISQRLFDERANEFKTTKAAVQATLARLQQAEINLGYAYIKAPISGRVSRAEVTLGNLVAAGPNAPLLTTIVSDDGIYAEFEVDEASYLDHIHRHARDRSTEKKIPVKITIGNSNTPYEGFIHSFDNQIDTSSGTIRARAFFQNDEGILLPGMFATVKMGSPILKDKILISEKAIGTNQSHKFVYVINEKNQAIYRKVLIGDRVDGRRQVIAGLEDGEKVISDGLIRIRPEMIVDPRDKVVKETIGPHDKQPAERS